MKKSRHQESVQTLSEPKLSENSKIVLVKRYLKKDNNGKTIEKPKDLFWRVAENIATADKYYDENSDTKKTAREFYDLMANLEFIPNSPTLMNAGRELQQLSACFVLPIRDSMEGIFDTLKDAAMIHKSGGGTGFSFSRLRQKNSIVKKTSGIASGPVSFMKIFDAATEAIKQGGTRRGANMGILRVDHPDIQEFINCKANMVSINNFNISVAITDKFMQALKKDEDYELIDPRTQQTAGKKSAKGIFDNIVKNAWKNGDPGMIFIDKINKKNPTHSQALIEATNPCGEEPLPPYGSCNLGSINLSKMVKESKLDWEKLKTVVHKSVHFLDNVIDMNKYPLPQIQEQTRGDRRIGLGIMGFADMLIKLNIQYDSEKAIALAEKLMKFIYDEAFEASANLAKQRGNFPFFDKSIYPEQGIKYLRNSTLLTVAPTGTISIIVGCSSGIEPLFAISFYRYQADTKMVDVNQEFEKQAKKDGFYSKELMKKIADKGTLHEIGEVPKRIKKIYRTAHDITPEWHIKMQTAFQKYVDASISKTINFPHEATVEDVAKAYKLAYKLDCKGITIYRDASRDTQVLSTGTTENHQNGNYQEQALVQPQNTNGFLPKKRPTILQGTTYKIKSAYGNLYITINSDENGKPFEVFSQMGKAGGFFAAKLEAISRLISLALRSGISVKQVITQLKGIRGPMPTWSEGGMILSLPDAIAQVIEKHINKGQQKLNLEFSGDSDNQDKAEIPKPVDIPASTVSLADSGFAPHCPDCGSILEMGEGCLKCHSCGYTKC
ncbi:MAG: vitamin B12-dependent ribonucleotide reductase [bacterium]